MLDIDPKRLVFIDETWTKTNMTRLYGRCVRGARLVDQTPHGHWQTTTFLAALRHDGLTAPLVIDGAIDGPMFRAYVQQHLVRTLRERDIVVMDNLSSHKVQGARVDRGGRSARGVSAAVQPGSESDRAGVCEDQIDPASGGTADA